MSNGRVCEAPIKGELIILGGSSSQALTKAICGYLQIEPGEVTIQTFPDGETFLKLESDVRGRDCFVVQSTAPPVNDNLMELLIFVDSLRRASANRITVVIPYFGYARQDCKAEGRTPITAKLVSNMITTAGAHRVVTMNLHAEQIQGFFDIPVDHLSASRALARQFMSLRLENTVLVSPDVGNLKKANKFASIVGAELAIIDKRRQSGNSIKAVRIIGDVEGRNVMIFDDMITTAGTIHGAARLVRDRGAKSVYVGATHGIFAGRAVERILDAGIDYVCVTDTIEIPDAVRKALPKLEVVSVAPLFGEAIRRIHRHESVSALFNCESEIR
ncbi:MAG: ribose-phosphate pyrophosphokinase [Phycisphaerae bacterium]|nr:ribose-phosphate pyrophosphokinase [Phycisphaerae bacterium]